MTPLERAEQAACEAFFDEPGIKPEWVGFRRIARAVLTAIREPSQAMDRAAAECESSYVGDIYTAMIDAALAETQ